MGFGFGGIPKSRLSGDFVSPEFWFPMRCREELLQSLYTQKNKLVNAFVIFWYSALDKQIGGLCLPPWKPKDLPQTLGLW